MCQRIGRALAESAEALLAQAIAHEALTAEREAFERQTRIDSLTGLGNRAAWDHALAQATGQPAARYAVLSVDLDHLKHVNDSFGHSAGDAVLRGAANVLRSVLRQSDLVCRVGGDEFMCLLPDAGEVEARAVIRRIERAASTWRLTEHALRPHMSMGWAAFESDWPQTLKAADERMYASKRRHQLHAAEPVVPPLRSRATRTRRSDAGTPGQTPIH
jgi:diguanylate cyclase (GGDEF)-like protein